MTWWKNGLLLAAGGVAGLALAAWLESEGKSDDYSRINGILTGQTEYNLYSKKLRTSNCKNWAFS